MTTITHWIAGAAQAGTGRTIPVIDPATARSVADVDLGDADTVKVAVAAAKTASVAWGRLPASRRVQAIYEFRNLLRDNIDNFAEIITREHGKTLDDARGEVARGLDAVELACGAPALIKGETSEQTGTNIDTISVLQPLGVVVGVTPFNFPVMIPLMMGAVAIAAGNSFILKPSEQDPGASLLMAKLAKQAGIPDGVFSVVQGQKDAVDHLIDHPDVAAVSFVGSTPVAHAIYRRAADQGKRVQAFGGAKNHLVVMPDAPLDAAADAVASAAFGAAGQRCMAVSVTVAVGDIADQLVEKLKERAEAIKVGPGIGDGVEVGPVVSAAAQQRIRGIVRDAAENGAHLVVDRSTESVPGYDEGYFVGPTIVDHVQPGSAIYQTEVFGPVLSIVRVETLDEALELIRNHPYGNGASIFTASGGAARKFQNEASAGMIGINVPVPVPVAAYAVAGWKNSVFGDTGLNNASWRFYTQPKYVTSRWDETVSGPDYGFRPN